MPKSKIPEIKGSLNGYNDIFQNTVNTAESNSNPGSETIVLIPLVELHPPKIHPFHVKHDEAMERLAKNIKENGVLEPGLVRSRAEGGYELISGNRRKMASELAGLPSMPVIIRELDDDSAAIIMVDCNLEQREVILPSEKAAAYKMKMEALGHKGIKDEKQSVEILMEQTGESRSQIFRLLRLTELIFELSDKLDAKQLAFNPAVALSHLSIQEQKAVASAMESFGVKPTVSQADKLKKLSQSGELTTDIINEVISMVKGSPKDIESKSIKQYQAYFPTDYTTEQMDDVITKLLRDWKLKGSLDLSESA